jgi:ORF39
MAGGKAILRAYEASTNIDRNTSQVRLQLYWENGDTKISGVPWEAYIDYDGGKRLSNSGTLTVEPNQTAMLIDQEVTVAHDGDGTRTIYYRGEFKNKSNNKVIPINNASLTLTTISRASYGADVTAEIAKPVTINITKREAWMRHSIWVRVGDWEQKIAGDNIDTSYTWTPPIDIANQFPNSISGTGTITYISYADGIERGRDIRKITVNVPTNLFKPGFTGFNLSDTNPVTQNLIPSPTHFVSTLSRIKVGFDGARGAAGASITGYYAEIVSGDTSAQTNGGILTVPTTMTDKQMTVRAKVQDSRGLWSDWREQPITVLAYFNPTLRFEAKRTGEKLDTITLKRFLKVAALSVNGTQKNTTKLTFKTRKVRTDTYTTDSTNEWQNISELNGSDVNLNGKYPADTSWEVLGRVEDKFSYTEFVITVSTDKVVMSYERDGVGIGKYREMGVLDVNGLIYSDRKQIQHHKLTEPNGAAIDNKVANLNDYRTTGFYSILGNYKNHPAQGEGGFLEVVESVSGYHQTLTTVSGRMFKRTVTNNSNGSWIEYTPKPEKEEKPEPPFIKRTVDFGWGVRAFFVKKGSVVTASLFRDANEVGVYEYGKMDNNTVPEGFRPATEVHLVANKNIGTGHAGVAVWHLASDGSIRLTNQSKDRAIYSGTVTYLTEDN